MKPITLRVLDGADRGRIFENLHAPISIGREEGNSIQLNDERVSRFHLKIQQDHEELVLTDLQSTNGTKVNNEEVQLRILRHGDMISLGRSTIVFGTRSQINHRMDQLGQSGGGKQEVVRKISSDVSVNNWQEDPNYQLALLEIDPPRLPERLSPGQAAQLSELLEYLQIHFRRVLSEVEVDPRNQRVELNREEWQRVIDLHARVAEYLKAIGQPE
ncbi:MAG: FHA domain-containing protein [Mariniblastus sp.]|nr:FHA domain-containing protein [Mariniblastus sp.]